jgi:hypothetical protein
MVCQFEKLSGKMREEGWQQGVGLMILPQTKIKRALGISFNTVSYIASKYSNALPTV